MDIKTEQHIALAARIQVTWHYARLLSPHEHRREALLRHNLTTETPDDVRRLQAEIAGVEGDIAAIRRDAHAAGVSDGELAPVLRGLERERRLVAAMVAAELRTPDAGDLQRRRSQWAIASRS